jgi:hypothetical protein
MNKIPFSQMEGILTQKKDLRKNRCFITFLDATKVSNIKEFIDRSRSVAPFYPITRGLKDGSSLAAARCCPGSLICPQQIA